MNTHFPIIEPKLQSAFHEALYFLHVQELQTLCTQLSLPMTGKKIHLIQRIFHFITTGEITDIPKLPKASCAQRGQHHPLSPETLILKGANKNDLKTRLFFKTLIGQHFHFTAFGIDWINERWAQGLPPTYLEFALMWQTEYTRRKASSNDPKAEWKYINFTQEYLRDSPKASHQEIIEAWKLKRIEQKSLIAGLLKIVF